MTNVSTIINIYKNGKGLVNPPRLNQFLGIKASRFNHVSDYNNFIPNKN